MSERAVAVVVDPIQSVKGKVWSHCKENDTDKSSKAEHQTRSACCKHARRVGFEPQFVPNVNRPVAAMDHKTLLVPKP